MFTIGAFTAYQYGEYFPTTLGNPINMESLEDFVFSVCYSVFCYVIGPLAILSLVWQLVLIFYKPKKPKKE
jgi:hypothetical protein